MKNFSDEELHSALRLFNHANEISNYYQKNRFIWDIEHLLSQRRWIVFPYRGIRTIQEVKTFSLPNIFFSFYETKEIADDGLGRADCYIGLTYHNYLAMESFKSILRSSKIKKNQPSKHILIGLMQGIHKSWNINVEQKINIIFRKRDPEYEIFKQFHPSNITVDEIVKAIKESDLNLPMEYDEHEVLNAITIINVNKHTSVNTFDTDLRELLSIFKRL
jgi:hypothetical protein